MEAGNVSESASPHATALARVMSRPGVRVLTVEGKTVILVGTVHVSRESAELVRAVIEETRPDAVCVELDARRYEALSRQQRWESYNLKEVIRTKQLSTLLANVLLASWQKRLGDRLGVLPGVEMLEAVSAADRLGIPIVLCDRDVRVTMRRAWRSTPFWQKSLLASSLLMSVFDTTPVTEASLRDFNKQDVLSAMIRELGETVPTLKAVLIDERDRYLAEKTLRADGNTVVSVVGAGHVEGMHAILRRARHGNLDALDEIPPVSSAWKWAGWAIPVVILGSIALIGYQKGPAAAGDNAVFWIVANGVPSGVGALLAWAHPLTIAAAVAGAPLTSLTPVIGVGYVTAFVQAWMRPPLVREFQTVAEDVVIPRRWWQNRLLRVFLAFVLPTIGSIIGTWVGGMRIVSNLF